MCTFCNKKGHQESVCRKRLATASASALAAATAPEGGDTTEDESFVFVFTTRAALQHTLVDGTSDDETFSAELDPIATEPNSKKIGDDIAVTIPPLEQDTDQGLEECTSELALTMRAKSGGWVLDSGATSSATYSEDDCIDIRPCDITVTAAGSEFRVERVGTAIINAVDVHGRVRVLKITNCLISTLFPYKLLAVHTFTNKGYVVVMKGTTMSIANPTAMSLSAKKDPSSGLFVLNCLLKEKKKRRATDNSLLLAKSYRDIPTTKDLSVLWQMHLRHGHRNFADVCRQYNIPLPAEMPACTSCVMGKSHTHPHLSNGFERASRKAQGFHTDFRGPFSCTTPSGSLYLLTIIDDYSRRVFGFLVKSQIEWFEIWVKFVTRVEAEIGHANCIQWLLSDNGAVYKSQAMTAYCAQGHSTKAFSTLFPVDHTAERTMRTLGEMAVTTMIHANMPKRAWGWAMLLACDVLNRTTESVASIRKQVRSSTPPDSRGGTGFDYPGKRRHYILLAACASNTSRLRSEQNWKLTPRPACIWE